MSGEVILQEDGAVAVVTISRPRRRNAIDLPTAEALAAAFDDVDARPDLRAVVLTGADGFFCAGLDLKALRETGQRPIVPGRGAFGLVERPPSTPLVAAVEGAALGGGFEIALACDLIVAAENVVFGLPEVGRGLVATAGGVLRLPRRIPYHAAMEIILTGEPITAARAHDVGLVSRLTPAGGALDAALVLARRVAAQAPLAVLASKRVVVESQAWPADEAFARMRELSDPVRESADAQEGARAFLERREPIWAGA